VVRWDKPGGKKEIRPVSRHADGWRIGAMPEPRPLYRLPELAQADRVIITEGEKAADAVRALGYTATTSAGGAEAAARADWSPLTGKNVIIMPDNDPPGRKYATTITSILARLEPAPVVRILELPGLPLGGDIVEWLAAGGTRGELEQLVEAAPVWTPDAQPWPDIVPLDVADLPDFPTYALPDVLRDWVTAESHATQTPADLAALLSLAVCSACVARRVEVEPRPGWREPVNLFTAVVLEPGNRKSAVFADATKPLRELEAELIEAARPEVARAQSTRRQAEARLRNLEKLAAEKGNADAGREAGNLAADLAEQPEPVLPRLVVDDATAEKLGIILAEQGGRIASMSPEGGVFDLMAGLYSKNGIPQFGVYLMGHAGDDLVTDRVTRKSVRVERPALTCAYTIQPAVIRGLAEHAAFRGRGLLARFLYAAPQSWIGRRVIAPEPVPDATREAYHRVVRSLAEADGETVLRLSPDAEARFRDWETEIEGMLADGGQMENIRDWGAKLAGATLRIAAVLHSVDHGPAGYIDRPTVEAAAEIARYLIHHAEAVLAMILAGGRTHDDDARYVLRWIARHGLRSFSKRDAQQHGRRRFPKADDIDPALDELVRRGYIRLRPAEPTGPGRPPSPTYEVNPAIFDGEGAKTCTQYTQYSAGESKNTNSENIENALCIPKTQTGGDGWEWGLPEGGHPAAESDTPADVGDGPLPWDKDEAGFLISKALAAHRAAECKDIPFALLDDIDVAYLNKDLKGLRAAVAAYLASIGQQPIK
jgi:hypothetical protein